MSLVVERLVKSFGDQMVLDHVSLAAETGKAFGLLGRNGAGKTTTIRMILGLIHMDQGEVLWHGQNIQEADVKIGYLPEERGLYPKSKVSDQLIYLGKLKGMDKRAAKNAVLHWLERLGIHEYMNKRVEELSKGNQQKIQLIAALLHDPDLVILDEPFSGLDPVNAELLKQVLQELLHQKKTIIFSSHQMQHVEEFCENIAILKKGNVVLQGNMTEIKRSYGRTHLKLQSPVNVAERLDLPGVRLEDSFLHTYHFRLQQEAQAQQVLHTLVQQNVQVDAFEIVEPSLHEIFIEKVGDAE